MVSSTDIPNTKAKTIEMVASKGIFKNPNKAPQNSKGKKLTTMEMKSTFTFLKIIAIIRPTIKMAASNPSKIEFRT